MAPGIDLLLRELTERALRAKRSETRVCDCGEPEVNKAGRCGFCQEQFESDEAADRALDMAEVSR